MIHVVGIGEEGLDGLTSLVKSLVLGADILVGGQRHLDMVESSARKISWGAGLNHGIDEITQNQDQEIVVLASGEPLWFGIGATLLRRLPDADIQVHPHVGAFSLIAARMGWSIPDCHCVTIHGRALENLNRYIGPDQRILVLSRDGKSPKEVADLLTKYGYGPSKITVFEHMGGDKEARHDGTATNWTAECESLNTIAIDCIAEEGARRLPKVTGLADDLFEHDGQLTKREVRAVTLSSLAPMPNELIWDVGAGCGSIAIEWMRSDSTCRAIAIEQNDKRRSMIAHNGASLGVPNLEIVDGVAPDCLDGLPTPDAVFIGGGLSVEGVFESCWDALPRGGRLIANAVTLEAEAKMLHLADKFSGQLSRIAISRTQKVGRMTSLKPMAPVLHMVLIKEE